ncbi:MAG: DUF808 family protein [Chitinophagaceae bacterium]
MASGFFAILDDIASLMDDVAVTSKVAANKTAAILGDDLAVNAKKATGFVSSRELPVLWGITKGSLVNKAILVPIALLLNAFFPIAIKYILMLGALYLAYEGVEKIIEYFLHRKEKEEETTEDKQGSTPTDEKAKIKSAITTDFILSIEIVIIALGTVLDQSLTIQILTVSVVSVLATVGVYGIVALIVRMDDAGYAIIGKTHDKGVLSKLGHLLVNALPFIIKILGVVGTLALLLVAGGIFAHKIDFLHHLWPQGPTVLKEFGFGLAAGLIAAALAAAAKAVAKLVGK